VYYWIFVVVVLVAIAMALLMPRYRLKKAIQAPFPDAWVEIVERNISVYKNLPMPLRLQLRNLIKQFLHQKHFSGAGGLEITDEIRVTIAAEACMLLVNRKTNVYPSLRYIIVYPTAFVVNRPQGGQDGVVSEGRKGLLGESWANGKVITDVTLFYIDWSDIQLPVTFMDPSSPWGMTSAILNTGSAHSLGAEAFLSAQLAPGLMFVTSIAWTEAELDEDTMPIMNGETGEFVVVPAGTQLPGTPKWNSSTMLQYYFNSAKLGFPFIELNHTYKGEVTDELSVQGIIPSWNLLNFRVGATIAKDLQVSLAVNNLLDDRQPMARWYPYMGSFVPEVQPEMWFITRPRSISLTLQKNF